jgi:rhodanese-related sulfurtransferase
MKRWMVWMSTLAVLLVLGLTVGCSDDSSPTGTDPVETEFEMLTGYMTTNSLDLPAMLTSWIIGAQALYDAGLENYFIIDIRSGTAYDTGHIPGAHNTTLGNVVAYEAANNTSELPVVVTCYTGHSAGHAVIALRLSGVTSAQSLGWGMSGWNSDFDSWTANTGDVALDYPGAWLDSGDPPAAASFETTPTLNTGAETGAEILAARVSSLVGGGLNGVNNTDVLASPGNYHLINYWARADWDLYGHIDGAYQVSPGDLSISTLAMLDPAGNNVVYCWSGQTASMIAAWLTVLGYDANTLKFSANGMIHADLQSHNWTSSTPAELDYEVTIDTEFSTLSAYMTANSMDLPTMLTSWITTASAIFDGGLANYFIMDLRIGDAYGPGTSGANGTVDYEDGHIPGAVKVALAEVVTFEAANNTADLPVIVVCYTGQSAGHAVMALRLSGVTDAKVLKWGMSGWHSDFDKWSATATGAPAHDGDNWVETDPPVLPSYMTRPALDTSATTGAAILEAMVNDMLSSFKGIGSSTVLTDPESYHVVNYWDQTDWDHYGHIDTAYQVAPGELGLSSLSVLDPSETVVTYCWTGQTSSMVTAWLSVLGYDAMSLTFGANSMIWNDLESHKWTSTTSAEYDYDTGM